MTGEAEWPWNQRVGNKQAHEESDPERARTHATAVCEQAPQRRCLGSRLGDGKAGVDEWENTVTNAACQGLATAHADTGRLTRHPGRRPLCAPELIGELGADSARRQRLHVVSCHLANTGKNVSAPGWSTEQVVVSAVVNRDDSLVARG